MISKQILLKKYFQLIAIFFASGTVVFSQIVDESGSLKEFLGGTSNSTAYDNYVSHISEGIADPGYNDYGPTWLDPQTNGFGDFRILPGNGPTLNYWREIFQKMIVQDTIAVAQMIADSSESFHYDFVRFQDTTVNQTYWMLRERLDYSYLDTNLTSDPSDDVIGSFRNGWGLYIFNPAATRNFVVVEVPHPTDDFIAPYNALELFQEIDAWAFMISGAGREVRWTGVGDYVNNSSLADPARNSNTVFEMFHEVLCDSLLTSQPHAPLILHVHSFDNNADHANYKSIVLSGGWDAGYANKPIRDVTGSHLDFVNFTTEYPIYAGEFGFHGALRVDNYYQVHYDGTFNFYGWTGSYALPHTYYLLGPITGVQMNYLRQFVPGWDVYEPWVQIELDEKPQLFDDLNISLDSLYNRPTMPRGYRNFSKILEYYAPFRTAVNNYLTNREMVPDVTPPDSIRNFRATFISDTFMALAWTPVEDTNFKTYKVYYDTGPITQESPVWDFSNDAHLSDMRQSSTVLQNLPELTPLNFRVAATDHYGNESIISDSILNYIPNLEAPDIYHRMLGSYPLENWPPQIMLENTSVIDFDSVWVQVFNSDGTPLGRYDLEPYSWTRWIGTMGVPENIASATDTIFYKVWLKEIAMINPPYSYPAEGYFLCLPSHESRLWIDSDLEMSDADFDPTLILGTTRWQWGAPTPATPAPHSGVNTWATNLAGNYGNYAYCKLTSPQIDLNGFGFQYLTFYHWYDMESSGSNPTRAYDGGNIQVSTDHGNTWAILTPEGGYSHTVNAVSNPLHQKKVFSGSSGGWRRAVCDLTPYINDTLTFQFQFGSDLNTTRLGWYLDDFAVVGVINDTPVTNISLMTPLDSTIWLPHRIDFYWTDAQDPDIGADIRYDLFYRTDSVWRAQTRLRDHFTSVNLADEQWAFTDTLVLDWFVRVSSQSDTLYSPDTFRVILPPRSLWPMSSFALINPPADTVILDSSTTISFSWHPASDLDIGTTMQYQLNIASDADTLTWYTGGDTTHWIGLDTLATLGLDSTGFDWWVRAVNATESRLADSTFTFFIDHYVGIREDELPKSFDLSTAYPNPFNPTTRFKVSVPHQQDVTIIVYNILGQQIRTLVNQNMLPGYHELTWHGLEENGRQVSSGLYFVRMQTQDFHITRKIVLLR